MTKEKEYFEKNRKHVKFHMGDRVEGKYNNIPFVGTVLLEHIISDDNVSRVHINLDLPLKHENVVYTMITVGPKTLKIRK
jgi:hypothetical protein